jgi:hypothetical protein
MTAILWRRHLAGVLARRAIQKPQTGRPRHKSDPRFTNANLRATAMPAASKKIVTLSSALQLGFRAFRSAGILPAGFRLDCNLNLSAGRRRYKTIFHTLILLGSLG